jgi:hypothetical protein
VRGRSGGKGYFRVLGGGCCVLREVTREGRCARKGKRKKGRSEIG